MRVRPWLRIVCSLIFLLPLTAGAQTPPACPDVEDGQKLVNPPEIKAANGVLSTTFDVRFQTFCVPSEVKSTDPDTKISIWKTTPLKLRTYTTPNRDTNPVREVFPEDRPRPSADLTGPTLRLSKYTPPSRRGDALRILLKNSLPFPRSTDCLSACESTVPPCKCDKPSVDALLKYCAEEQSKPDNPPPPAKCCCIINCTQKSPNCFHGDNVTNLHFHGTHASPQEPQDFVLLDLYPRRPQDAPAMDHAEGSHGAYSRVEFGQFQYAVDPFGARQAEGSHWYHPHKHGSVGQQVSNGMAGALVIEGPFDYDFLWKYYNPATSEKVMVIQSVASEPSLFTSPGATRGQILVNGQIKPQITGKPGEIQRWRIVNATMSARTLLEITFPEKTTFRQIALDGVRFSPANYACQPLFNFNQNKPSFPCDPNPSVGPTIIRIAPGNRADFLVQFPPTETRKGTEGLRVERKLVEIEGEESGNRKLLRARDEQMAPGPAEPALFTMVIDDGIEGNDDEPKMLKAGAPTLPNPKDWPQMPEYLTIITDDEVKQQEPVKMTFQQFLADRNQQWPYGNSPLSSFKIDGRQFCPTCANVTTQMSRKVPTTTAVEWTVSNATQLPHPFHIHTNPFQVFSVKGVSVQGKGSPPQPEPFWMDTLVIPTATVVPASVPADPFEKITITPASFVFRQRYLDFTGEYVLHCHFLGHEDRGMMFAVQTVCPDTYRPAAGKYSRPTIDPNGECNFPPFSNPLPLCKKDDPNFCPKE